MAPLEALGFALAGYGCTTCIGNSGPLDEPVAEAIEANDLVVAAVLSGNRNFEGRIHPLARASYLASPPLVVAFALAGRVDIDLTTEPLGTGDGRAARLPRRHLAVAGRDPLGHRAPRSTRSSSAGPTRSCSRATSAGARCRSPTGDRYAWDAASTYVAKPPFFDGLRSEPAPLDGHRRRPRAGGPRRLGHDRPHLARRLDRAVVARRPVAPGARRRPARVQLVRRPARPPRGDDPRHVRATSGCATRLVARAGGPVHGPPARRRGGLHLRRRRCATARTACRSIVIAGKEYGSGSSRDWAAKGPLLLGVEAVIAETFERIHRTNLVGMGVLPLQFLPGDSAASLGLTGRETYSILGLEGGPTPRQGVTSSTVATGGRR